jgi:hypothetical protein
VAFLKISAFILKNDEVSVVYAWSFFVFFGRFCLFIVSKNTRDFLASSETLAMRGL